MGRASNRKKARRLAGHGARQASRVGPPAVVAPQWPEGSLRGRFFGARDVVQTESAPAESCGQPPKLASVPDAKAHGWWQGYVAFWLGRSARVDDRSRLDLGLAGRGGGRLSCPLCELVLGVCGQFRSNLHGEVSEPVMPWQPAQARLHQRASGGGVTP
jgi:hypothetical protein